MTNTYDELGAALDESLRLGRVRQGIVEELGKGVEFMRSRLHEVEDPTVRAKILALIAAYDRGDYDAIAHMTKLGDTEGDDR